LEHREDGTVIDLATGDSLDTAEKSVASMQHCGKPVLTYGRHEAVYRRSMAEPLTWRQRYLLQ
jgi:uncharacterized membrane protein